MEKNDKINQAHFIKNEIDTIIWNKLRAKIDEYNGILVNIAKEFCPFKINEIITLPNGKRGEIKKIEYEIIDNEFRNQYIDCLSELELGRIDDLQNFYIFFEKRRKFSITWKISGFREKKDGSIGLRPFVHLSPLFNDIDIEEKKMLPKKFKNAV